MVQRWISYTQSDAGRARGYYENFYDDADSYEDGVAKLRAIPGAVLKQLRRGQMVTLRRSEPEDVASPDRLEALVWVKAKGPPMQLVLVDNRGIRPIGEEWEKTVSVLGLPTLEDGFLGGPVFGYGDTSPMVKWQKKYKKDWHTAWSLCDSGSLLIFLAADALSARRVGAVLAACLRDALGNLLSTQLGPRLELLEEFEGWTVGKVSAESVYHHAEKMAVPVEQLCGSVGALGDVLSILTKDNVALTLSGHTLSSTAVVAMRSITVLQDVYDEAIARRDRRNADIVRSHISLVEIIFEDLWPKAGRGRR